MSLFFKLRFNSFVIVDNSVKGLIYAMDSWIKKESPNFDACWKSVVCIVADKLGGNNRPAAMQIAQKWQGKMKPMLQYSNPL